LAVKACGRERGLVMAGDPTDARVRRVDGGQGPGGAKALDVEDRLRHCLSTDEWLDLRSGDPSEDDPFGEAAWAPDRHIVSELIATLVTTPLEPSRGGGSMRIRGAPRS
jgi:hypothetical protein